MDSGNSGSLQSSSGGDGGGGGGGGGGGDEVYDSRTESMFLTQSTHFNPIPILQPPSHHHHHQQQTPSTFFDPTSFSQPLNPNPNPNPNPIYNLDSLWSRNPNPNPMYNLETHQDPTFNPNTVDGNINTDTGPEKVTKKPKKRTRASRRAPTTVLTTDTTNFRQMVQEFTGIPAAPFSASTSSSSPFSRRRDIYGGGVTPLHPLRPSAQKIQLQQQPSYLNSTTATTSNFHLPPSETHGFTKQPLNLSNLSNLTSLQNQMFPFQSISQTSNPQQMTERDQRSEPPNMFTGSSSTSLKRWRSENENMMNFEGGNGNTHNGVVSSRSDGDQLPGNEDSWICPSD